MILTEIQDRIAERLDSIEESLESVVNQPVDYERREILQQSQKELKALLDL